MVRVAVSPQKSLQPEHIAVFAAAQDHRSADILLQQRDTAQDERAHDPFAQLSLLHHQLAKPRGWNEKRVDI